MKEEALRLAEALTIPLAGRYISTDDIKKAGQMIKTLLEMTEGKSDVDATLAQRETTHGNFETQAKISQALKDVVDLCEGYQQLNCPQAEALDMILHKIARILNGNPNFIDSWRDIAGYATLVVNHLDRAEGATDVKIKRVIRKDNQWVDQ